MTGKKLRVKFLPQTILLDEVISLDIHISKDVELTFLSTILAYRRPIPLIAVIANIIFLLPANQELISFQTDI